MNLIFAILVVSLVSTHGAIELPVDYETQVTSIIQEAEQIAVESAKALDLFDDIVFDPLQQVEEAVQSIEKRKEENERCVIAQELVVTLTVDTMHDEMNSCGVVAAKTSAEIMMDINEAIQQLIFDGIDVARTLQKCRKYKNNVLRSSCFARLSVKATLYMKNARKSIKTIKKSTSVRIPAVFSDADICTHAAAEKAIEQLNYVNNEIDSCISGI